MTYYLNWPRNCDVTFWHFTWKHCNLRPAAPQGAIVSSSIIRRRNKNMFKNIMFLTSMLINTHAHSLFTVWSVAPVDSYLIDTDSSKRATMSWQRLTSKLLGSAGRLSARNRLLLDKTAKPAASCACLHSAGDDITSKRKPVKTTSSKIAEACRRFLSSESGPPSNKLPPLMHFPQIIWPSIIKSIRNFILTTFIIKPYMDREFSLPDFVTGSKKAVEVVSQKIAEGDVKALEGLVTEDVLPAIQKALAMMSLSQREQISVNADDIYFSFPYQVSDHSHYAYWRK